MPRRRQGPAWGQHIPPPVTLLLLLLSALQPSSAASSNAEPDAATNVTVAATISSIDAGRQQQQQQEANQQDPTLLDSAITFQTDAAQYQQEEQQAVSSNSFNISAASISALQQHQEHPQQQQQQKVQVMMMTANHPDMAGDADYSDDQYGMFRTKRHEAQAPPPQVVTAPQPRLSRHQLMQLQKEQLWKQQQQGQQGQGQGKQQQQQQHDDHHHHQQQEQVGDKKEHQHPAADPSSSAQHPPQQHDSNDRHPAQPVDAEEDNEVLSDQWQEHIQKLLKQRREKQQQQQQHASREQQRDDGHSSLDHHQKQSSGLVQQEVDMDDQLQLQLRDTKKQSSEELREQLMHHRWSQDQDHQQQQHKDGDADGDGWPARMQPKGHDDMLQQQQHLPADGQIRPGVMNKLSSLWGELVDVKKPLWQQLQQEQEQLQQQQQQQRPATAADAADINLDDLDLNMLQLPALKPHSSKPSAEQEEPPTKHRHGSAHKDDEDDKQQEKEQKDKDGPAHNRGRQQRQQEEDEEEDIKARQHLEQHALHVREQQQLESRLHEQEQQLQQRMAEQKLLDQRLKKRKMQLEQLVQEHKQQQQHKQEDEQRLQEQQQQLAEQLQQQKELAQQLNEQHQQLLDQQALLAKAWRLEQQQHEQHILEHQAREQKLQEQKQRLLQLKDDLVQEQKQQQQQKVQLQGQQQHQQAQEEEDEDVDRRVHEREQRLALRKKIHRKSRQRVQQVDGHSNLKQDDSPYDSGGSGLVDWHDGAEVISEEEQEKLERRYPQYGYKPRQQQKRPYYHSSGPLHSSSQHDGMDVMLQQAVPSATPLWSLPEDSHDQEQDQKQEQQGMPTNTTDKAAPRSFAGQAEPKQAAVTQQQAAQEEANKGGSVEAKIQQQDQQTAATQAAPAAPAVEKSQAEVSAPSVPAQQAATQPQPQGLQVQAAAVGNEIQQAAQQQQPAASTTTAITTAAQQQQQQQQQHRRHLLLQATELDNDNQHQHHHHHQSGGGVQVQGSVIRISVPHKTIQHVIYQKQQQEQQVALTRYVPPWLLELQQEQEDEYSTTDENLLHGGEEEEKRLQRKAGRGWGNDDDDDNDSSSAADGYNAWKEEKRQRWQERQEQYHQQHQQHQQKQQKQPSDDYNDSRHKSSSRAGRGHDEADNEAEKTEHEAREREHQLQEQHSRDAHDDEWEKRQQQRQRQQWAENEQEEEQQGQEQEQHKPHHGGPKLDLPMWEDLLGDGAKDQEQQQGYGGQGQAPEQQEKQEQKQEGKQEDEEQQSPTTPPEPAPKPWQQQDLFQRVLSRSGGPTKKWMQRSTGGSGSGGHKHAGGGSSGSSQPWQKNDFFGSVGKLPHSSPSSSSPPSSSPSSSSNTNNTNTSAPAPAPSSSPNASSSQPPQQQPEQQDKHDLLDDLKQMPTPAPNEQLVTFPKPEPRDQQEQQQQQQPPQEQLGDQAGEDEELEGEQEEEQQGEPLPGRNRGGGGSSDNDLLKQLLPPPGRQQEAQPVEKVTATPSPAQPLPSTPAPAPAPQPAQQQQPAAPAPSSQQQQQQQQGPVLRSKKRVTRGLEPLLPDAPAAADTQQPGGSSQQQPAAVQPPQLPQQQKWLADQIIGGEADIDTANPFCSSEQQQVQCGQMPVATAEEQEAHRVCCKTFAPRKVPAALLPPAPVAMDAERWDLEADGPLSEPLDWWWFAQGKGSCVPMNLAKIPIFPAPQVAVVERQAVPGLSRLQISRIKEAAMKHRKWIRRRYDRISATADAKSEGSKPIFRHPGGFAGAAELALAQWRLRSFRDPQAAALLTLIKGVGVPPKMYFNGSTVWHPPTDTPLNYDKPLPMEKVLVGYGGFNKASTCPAQYPPSAPWNICSHIAFVEMDAQMTYKQAVAHLMTRKEQYAHNVLDIIASWAATSKTWGLQNENGPLEAAWGVAAMARSLETLRGSAMSGDLLQKWYKTRQDFLTWYHAVPHPGMVFYVDVMTKRSLEAGRTTVYGNWHSSIAEAWMAVGVLSDNRELFKKGKELYTATSESYFRWGRYTNSTEGRLIGECSETLRDIVHTQFGLGGMLQAAEMAWQQNIDLYQADGYALASAMELTARFINAWDAGKNESLLPPNYKFYDTSMPAPPAGTDWAFDIQKQAWFARDRQSKKIVSQLSDGFKYLLAVKYLPAGWELGYNHYAGRLGMKLTETTLLLQRYKVDWHEFHWGLGTLSHGNSATLLWRSGVTREVLCDVGVDESDPHNLRTGGNSGNNGTAGAQLSDRDVVLLQSLPAQQQQQQRPGKAAAASGPQLVAS